MIPSFQQKNPKGATPEFHLLLLITRKEATKLQDAKFPKLMPDLLRNAHGSCPLKAFLYPPLSCLTIFDVGV
jgi:hypothetical protein